MKRTIAVIGCVAALFGGAVATGASAAHHRPQTFVKRHDGFVQPGQVLTIKSTCPGNATFVGGYATVGTANARIDAQDVTPDEHGWSATAQSTDDETAQFTVTAVCIR